VESEPLPLLLELKLKFGMMKEELKGLMKQKELEKREDL
jgi:hypothetical protein